ncbi:hypothetical protein GCM10027440_05430 [Nocardiopsis coralliicola]
MAAIAIAAAIAMAIPAIAIADPDYFWGEADCGSDGTGPGCGVGAESGEGAPGREGSSEGAPRPDGSASGSASTSGGAMAGTVCSGEGNGQECTTSVAEAADPEAGDGEPAFDPAAVADEARDALALPDPGIATSPDQGSPVLVRVPVWLWIDEETWQPETAEAEVPGGSVSVTATPESASWEMGDGAVVECEGPGRAYDPARDDPAASSPECGHTYTTAAERGGFPVEVGVVWSVTWEASDGSGGELDPLVTAAGAELGVVESHGLVEHAT